MHKNNLLVQRNVLSLDTRSLIRAPSLRGPRARFEHSLDEQ